MPYTTPALAEFPTLINGVLRVIWDMTGDKVEPQRFAEEFTSAPDLSARAQFHIDRLNGLQALVVTRGEVSLPTPPEPPVLTREAIDQETFVAAVAKTRLAQRAFDTAKQALDASLITSIAAATQTLADAQAAMKAAYKPGYDDLLAGIP